MTRDFDVLEQWAGPRALGNSAPGLPSGLDSLKYGRPTSETGYSVNSGISNVVLNSGDSETRPANISMLYCIKYNNL